jgi:hypothetical protein
MTRSLVRFSVLLAAFSFAAILAFPAVASATTGPSESCARAVSRSNIDLGSGDTTGTTYSITNGTYVLNATFNQNAGTDDPYLVTTFVQDNVNNQVDVTIANLDSGSDIVSGDYVLQWFCS